MSLVVEVNGLSQAGFDGVFVARALVLTGVIEGEQDLSSKERSRLLCHMRRAIGALHSGMEIDAPHGELGYV